MADDGLAARVRHTLRNVPDFPKPGIIFKDITPVLADAALFAEVIAAMATWYQGSGVTHVAGVESRGFIFAAPIACAIGAGFLPIRKLGKLPSQTVVREYALEYGSDCLEMHSDACVAGSRVVLVDDVLATGGTAAAAASLIEAIGSAVIGSAFLLAIDSLHGADRLQGRPVRVLVHV